jgi:hypothetical protein
MDHTQAIATLFAGGVGALAGGSLKGPFQTLENWWFINFGYNTALEKEKKDILLKANAEKYAADIRNGVEKIPDKYLQQPKASIIGPAMETSAYFIDEDELRRMFANIIVASVDSRKNDYLHTSFANIIREMSDIDAKLLKEIYSSRGQRIPTVTFRGDKKDSSEYYLFYQNTILLNNLALTYQESSLSISNLVRLGLIDITYDRRIPDESEYDKFNYALQKMEVDEIIRHGSLSNNAHLETEKGVITISPYGLNFCRVVLPN